MTTTDGRAPRAPKHWPATWWRASGDFERLTLLREHLQPDQEQPAALEFRRLLSMGRE